MKPTVPLPIIRRKIREVLAIRAGYPKTEAMIHEGVNYLVGGGVSLQETRNGMEWNHGENYIRSDYDKEADETNWFITDAGIAKQNIK